MIILGLLNGGMKVWLCVVVNFFVVVVEVLNVLLIKIILILLLLKNFICDIFCCGVVVGIKIVVGMVICLYVYVIFCVWFFVFVYIIFFFNCFVDNLEIV